MNTLATGSLSNPHNDGITCFISAKLIRSFWTMGFTGTSHFRVWSGLWEEESFIVSTRDVTSWRGRLQRFPVIMSIRVSWGLLFAERVSCLTPPGLPRAPRICFDKTAWHVFSVSDALNEGDNEAVQAPSSIVLTDGSQVMSEAVLKCFQIAFFYWFLPFWGLY